MLIGLASASDSTLAAQVPSLESPTPGQSQESAPPQAPEPAPVEPSQIPIVNGPWWADRDAHHNTWSLPGD